LIFFDWRRKYFYYKKRSKNESLRKMALKIGDIETNFGVRSFDAKISRQEYEELPKTPLYFVLDNLRSAFNTGAFFRLGDILRVSGIYLCGYTAFPPHIKLEKTSLGTTDFVPWKHFEKTEDAISDLKQKGISVWAAETAEQAERYDKMSVEKPLALLFGNEASGVSQEILALCDGIVEIPTFGFKNSMNVATAGAVLGFEIAKKLEIFDKFRSLNK